MSTALRKEVDRCLKELNWKIEVEYIGFGEEGDQ